VPKASANLHFNDQQKKRRRISSAWKTMDYLPGTGLFSCYAAGSCCRRHVLLLPGAERGKFGQGKRLRPTFCIQTAGGQACTPVLMITRQRGSSQDVAKQLAPLSKSSLRQAQDCRNIRIY